MMKRALILAVSASVLLSACATPTVVETKKVGDAGLTCAQIKNEISEASEFEKKARAERKVTGTNVAAAVLFFPALVATYSNTEEAIDAAKERRENMVKLANTKGCPPSMMNDDYVEAVKPAPVPVPAKTSTPAKAPARTPAKTTTKAKVAS